MRVSGAGTSRPSRTRLQWPPYRQSFGTLVVVSLLVASPAAAADGDESGLFVDGNVGVGFSSARYRYEGMTLGGFGAPVRPLTLETTVSSIAVSVGATPAFAFSRVWALGVGFDALVLPAVGRTTGLGASTISSVATVSASLVGLVRPTRTFEVSVAGGWSSASAGGDTEDIGAADNVFTFEHLAGPRGALRAGWVTTSGFGVGASATFASLTGTHTTYRPVTLAVLATFATW